MREVIAEELEGVREEQTRAEGSDLAMLEGWEKALVWVLRQLPEEG
jgi:hypothetical protein